MYTTSIKDINLKLSEPQKNNREIRKPKKDLPEEWENVESVFHH